MALLATHMSLLVKQQMFSQPIPKPHEFQSSAAKNSGGSQELIKYAITGGWGCREIRSLSLIEAGILARVCLNLTAAWFTYEL